MKVINNLEQIKEYMTAIGQYDFVSELYYRFKYSDYKVPHNIGIHSTVFDITLSDVENNFNEYISYDGIWSRLYFKLPNKVEGHDYHLLDIDEKQMPMYDEIINIVGDKFVYAFDSPNGKHIIIDGISDDIIKLCEDNYIYLTNGDKRIIVVLYSKDVSDIDPFPNGIPYDIPE